jgi:hypothetical protein
LQAVARFSLPHEAHVARAALASHGIAAVVDHDHGPFPSAASWVYVRVAQTDVERARSVLERGPVVGSEGGHGIESRSSAVEVEPAPDDDMRPMRLSRRILLARWFLYGQAVSGVVAVPLTLRSPRVSLGFLLMAIGSLVLALWSHHSPRTAFGVAVVFEVLLVAGTVAVRGPVGSLGLIAVLAVYFAWLAAGQDPPELLQARPKTTRSVEADIGDAWK